MIKTLELKNFRKHRSLTINLVPGLNCLRGANEQGKTTICEAICYALFGSKMLRGSFADAVSYGEAENTLRVKLVLEVDGVEYVIVRGKSGAEVTTGSVIVTGQNETRNYMERVLGYSADTAKLLLVAQQNDVRGVLSSGGASASSLVEKLANLKLIEQIVDAIQTTLPSGNTKTLEGQIVMAENRVGSVPELPNKEALLQLQNDLTLASAHREEIESHTSTLATKIIAVNVDIARVSETQKQHQQYLLDRENLAAQAVFPEDPGVTEEDIAKAGILAENTEALKKLQAAYATVFPKTGLSWDGDFESFKAEMGKTVKSIEYTNQKLQDLAVDKVREEGKIIPEGSCQFCGKLTSEMPSIAEVNAKAIKAISEIEDRMLEHKKEKKEMEAALCDLQRLEAVCTKIKNLAGTHFSLSDSVPPIPTWIGQPPGQIGDVPDVKGMQKKLSNYRSALSKAEAAKERLEKLVEPKVLDSKKLEQELSKLSSEKKELDEKLSAISNLSSKVREEERVYEEKVKAFNAALASHEEAKASVQNLKDALSEMHKHNEIIKILRNARPEIASKVWGVLLTSVSHYFSQIRGFESPVAKDADSFKVEGKDVENLSGSTLDALGLAIRIALSKVFLPGSGMLFVDEVFAGCDEERELAGLATIAQAGFSQTILITHSDLADAVADNLVVL